MKGYEKIKLQEPLSTGELFEKIKGGNFPNGTPTLMGSGKMVRMDFPANNKYKVTASVSGKTITIAETYNGVGGLAKESGMELLTNGWSKFFNKNRDENCSDIVEIKNEITRILGL